MVQTKSQYSFIAANDRLEYATVLCRLFFIVLPKLRHVWIQLLVFVLSGFSWFDFKESLCQHGREEQRQNERCQQRNRHCQSQRTKENSSHASQQCER